MLMKMNQWLRASKYINYNRLATANYSKVRASSLIAQGVWEIFSCSKVTPSLAGGVECNLCGWTGKKFVNFYTGYDHVYKNAVCPQCYSHPRHRSYSLILQQILSGLNGKAKTLHFAPEHHIQQVITSFANVDYLSVDIDHHKAMRREDIKNLSFKDHSFDVIICIHVFEHIDDDKRAMAEIYRVLKPGGVALLDVPIDLERAVTYEDDTITTPEARTKAFWQWDHVRLYGRDYSQKLRDIGFQVQERHYVQEQSSDYVKKYGLEVAPNFVCSK